MKNILAAAIVAAVSATASAQSISNKFENTYARPVAAEGLRLSVFTSALQFTVKTNFWPTEKTAMDNTVGLAVGYAKLPIGGAGFTTNLAYMNIHKEDLDLGNARADVNLAFAANQWLVFKGGLNASKIVTGEMAKYFQLGFGGQIGASLQFSETIGLDLGYVVMNQSAKVGTATADYVLEGPEVGLTGTF